MRILIVGTGGVGGFYGGLLAKAGHDVTFLARGQHFQALKESGLIVKSTVGDFTIKPVQVISAVKEAKAPDLVLVCVKTYDTEELSRNLVSVVDRNTVIISLQNGIDNDEIMQKYLAEPIIVPGITYVVSQRSAPGLIEQTSGQRTVIFGTRDGHHQQVLEKIEKTMQDAGIEASNSQHIEKQLWTKFVWIIAFAGMTSLCRSSIGPISKDAGTMSIYAKCLKEAFLVADALNINLEPEKYETMIHRVKNLLKMSFESKSSMLIDIENHRRTEIESLHGKLCQLARRVSLAMPINEIIYYAIRLTHTNL